MLAILLLGVGAASIDAPYPAVAPLHHAPTIMLVVAAPWLLRRWPISTAAVANILMFMLLHTLGGRYTYTNVPYDLWAKALTGHGLNEALGFTRNHYDRLVHFSYGLLAIRPTVEVLSRHAGVSNRLALYVAVECVLAVGCLYEIFEWLLTLVAAGADAEAYNGQQGDIWDAQKDMALAALGAVVGVAIAVATRRRVS